MLRAAQKRRRRLYGFFGGDGGAFAVPGLSAVSERMARFSLGLGEERAPARWASPPRSCWRRR